ncbi:hypothetical protein O181_106464 [Austropuccinia psidii MF-1]|uniref:Reverse transcriptase/retrotransposon-derived protein RNase H-like domain-containing protein n=1 Tax=Austropuccinia psidii MF-1 TaxID=1389203 RepID=A0A9Q3PM32_9BASI|nr:hypothetical protein [Austropuccinia psidii MF-1]
MSEFPGKIPLIILDSSESPSSFLTHYTKYMVELPSFPSFEWDLLVIDTPKQGLITFNADHKDYHEPSKSFSNDFSSAKSCVALVGDSRTPSFPSSVHIPSLNSNQSLLSSRDKVFKDIQDVGEENSVSSLHLFFGNMDLPPSSYHDSLKELWDEEEEPEQIETVMKVVPSVYHQYLDNNSKKISFLTSFLKKNSSFPLNEEALRQFHQLKEAFTIAPILSHFAPSLPTIVETDASDYALGAVLSQIGDSGKHPIAFDRCKPLPAELNYEIHEKEFSLIIPHFNILRHQRFLLAVKPTGLTFSLSATFQSPTALAAWLPIQMHCVTAKEAGAFPIIISKSLYHGYPSEPNQQGGFIQ